MTVAEFIEAASEAGVSIVRQGTAPTSPANGLIWIDTYNARIHEHDAGLDAWAELTPAELAARVGTPQVEVLTLDEILAAVRDRRCELRVANGQLEVVGHEACTEELLSAIEAHEADLIAALPEWTHQPRRWHRPSYTGDWWNGRGWADER